MTDLNKYEFSKRENILFYCGIAAAGIAVSYLMYRNILFSAVIFPFSGRIKGFVREIIIKNRKRRYMSEFKDFLFMVSTAIGAGRSMKDAIGESIPSLRNIYGEKATLTDDLILAHERMVKGGENDVRVLEDLSEASGLEDVQDFVTIYSICRETGADLISALNRATSVIMDKMSIEREIDEIIKRKENEGLVIFAMPALIIMFLNLTAPDYISPLYETIAGRIIMTAVTAASIGIYAMIQRITNVEI
jgi:tight adherence protein B